MSDSVDQEERMQFLQRVEEALQEPQTTRLDLLPKDQIR